MIKTGSILSYLGIFLGINGVIMLIPAIAGGLMGEGVFYNYQIAGAASFITGFLLSYRFRRSQMDLGSVMVLASLMIILVSIIGAVPFLPYATPADALFESVSGFTTTGITVLHPEQLPKSLLLWRSLTQWLGGIGIIILFIVTLPSAGISSYHTQGGSADERGVKSRVPRSIRRVGLVYVFYTLLGIGLFALAGMGIFDAVAHSLTAISTGGFSTKNSSLAFFSSPAINAVAILLMVLGSTSFIVHGYIWKGRIRSYLKNTEVWMFWGIVAAFSVIVFLMGAWDISSSVFYSVSSLTTSGFRVSEIQPGPVLLPLIVMMVFGGFAGSASGGIKLIRIFVLAKGVWWYGKKLVLPKKAIVPFRAGEGFIETGELTKVFMFALAYLAILAFTTICLYAMGYPAMTSAFEAASAQGNAGFSLVDAASMPVLGKILLMASMIIGRLEIFPVVALLLSLLRIRH